MRYSLRIRVCLLHCQKWHQVFEGTQVMEGWMSSIDADDGYVSDSFLQEGDPAVITTKEW